MLNRRSLRIKGMQAIFAYHTARQSEYQICKTDAQAHFFIDMNSMEVQDKEGLSRDRSDTAIAFDTYHKNGVDGIAEGTKSEIIDAVKNANVDYHNRLKNNKSHFKKRMLADISTIYDCYIKLLYLIVEIQMLIDQEKRKKNNSHNNFQNNIVINKLKNYEPLGVESARRNVSWDTSLVKAWYKEYIKTQEYFIEYDNLTKTSLEDDLAFVQETFKTVIFKHQNINDYFEVLDIGWVENKPILRSMVLKTVKSIEDEDSNPLLVKLSKNWEEDLLFLKELYDLSIDKEKEYEAMIKTRSKNWEMDRVALTDRIILEMAIAEMIHFSSIPVKVSINEYIELSKLYSTPKSKQFVNGLLDAISVDLKGSGHIKKSGRGLLDNK